MALQLNLIHPRTQNPGHWSHLEKYIFSKIEQHIPKRICTISDIVHHKTRIYKRSHITDTDFSYGAKILSSAKGIKCIAAINHSKQIYLPIRDLKRYWWHLCHYKVDHPFVIFNINSQVYSLERHVIFCDTRLSSVPTIELQCVKNSVCS